MYLQRNVTIAIQLLMVERPAEHMMRQNLAKEISTRLIFRVKKSGKIRRSLRDSTRWLPLD